MLPALTLESAPAAHLDRYGCVGLDWHTPIFRVHTYLLSDGRLLDPVMWIGNTCWPITPDADRGGRLDPPWYPTRPALGA